MKDTETDTGGYQESGTHLSFIGMRPNLKRVFCFLLRCLCSILRNSMYAQYAVAGTAPAAQVRGDGTSLGLLGFSFKREESKLERRHKIRLFLF